jgi:hypothetical protein
MNKVESLKDSLGVSERCQDYQHVENLMACTNDVELSPAPSLRHLLEVSQFHGFLRPRSFSISTDLESICRGAHGVQYKCSDNPHDAHPLALNVPSILVYSM